ncbi:hypothetical protein TVAG_449890 [Trichomonas vaginalis G3]|uniref:CRC domain-containing protein n=1 Tax=Trichomonas vaginalis (strain ATCC PRA-98 / G3) TaxID=412133 RepID=A2F4D3_TRIV3|nr:Tesmin/TSO1-like CXC domain, cysteine-rich domain family [Trichomonas vaginalis G3]EAY00253.1 hypothetical protein TVAG_449890 [Trichomonas vaginalis G3]KAI5536808.1 Tesmin/TSO1-like CXC domain, cysteine-rich domain family [Trichomonas vaginalis G3]|eukprot:XP_001313182.1 hypothetical protein [Trichomonas vaginalis G3]
MTTEEGCCCCNGNCLSLDCPCFKRGGICGPNCKCQNCKNKSGWDTERLNAIENMLSQNTVAFTSTDQLYPEEYNLISNFAMLSSSIDSEQFHSKQRDIPISRLLTQEVTQQAIKTVISAAHRQYNKQPAAENIEELLENCVSSEFENVLKAILSAVQQQSAQ